LAEYFSFWLRKVESKTKEFILFFAETEALCQKMALV